MEVKPRIVALDIGTKRIGVAISDPFCIFASPIGCIIRQKDFQALKEIKEICSKYETNRILIGLPYNMDGTLGFQAQNCIDFIEPLKKEYEILYQDERMSSERAEEILRKKKIKYTKNKELVDIESACIILQEYIDSKG